MALTKIADKEFTSAYALCKQIDNLFSKLSVAENSLMKICENIRSTNELDYLLISKVLNQKGINPRNTTDSVVEEILINIHEISSLNLKSNENQTGLMSSFNRLIHYKIANIENIVHILNKAELMSDFNVSLKRNEKVYKSIINRLKS